MLIILGYHSSKFEFQTVWIKLYQRCKKNKKIQKLIWKNLIFLNEDCSNSWSYYSPSLKRFFWTYLNDLKDILTEYFLKLTIKLDEK